MGAKPFSLERVTQLMRNPFADEKGNPMKESHSLLREASRGEYYSLREGDSPETNPIRYGEGKAHGVNIIHLEKGAPWKGGKPLAGDYHSLGGDAPKATPNRCGEGSLLR